jgi:hypothetical protein
VVRTTLPVKVFSGNSLTEMLAVCPDLMVLACLGNTYENAKRIDPRYFKEAATCGGRIGALRRGAAARHCRARSCRSRCSTRAAATARINQRTDFNIPCSYYTSERREHVLESLQSFQTPNVRFIGGDGSLGGVDVCLHCINGCFGYVVSSLRLISDLIRYDVLLREIFIALIGHARVLHIRDRMIEIRLGLSKARNGLR